MVDSTTISGEDIDYFDLSYYYFAVTKENKGKYTLLCLNINKIHCGACKDVMKDIDSISLEYLQN